MKPIKYRARHFNDTKDIQLYVDILHWCGNFWRNREAENKLEALFKQEISTGVYGCSLVTDLFLRVFCEEHEVDIKDKKIMSIVEAAIGCYTSFGWIYHSYEYDLLQAVQARGARERKATKEKEEIKDEEERIERRKRLGLI